MAKQRNKIKNDVIKQIRLLLGDGMIDIELDPEHYDLAIDIAVDKIRQRSENAVQEDFYTLELQEDVAEYTLPKEISEVKKIHHRSFGHGISAGVDMDPFELAYANSYFFMNNHVGGISTYELFAQYRETLNRVAAQDIQFIWNPLSHKIKLLRKFATLPGAQGGVSLNGETMKADAMTDIDKLETELKLYIDGSAPLGVMIG